MTIPHRRDPDVCGKERGGPREPENFRRRAASALVLAPLAIAAAVLGGWIFAAACALTAVLMLREWSALVAPTAQSRILAAGLPALLIATALAKTGAPGAGVAVLILGALAATAITFRRASGSGASAWWPGAGVIYAGVVLICPIGLRSDPEIGLAALLFLFATVWATDIFAYLVGRWLGGPLLWPRLSPNKTWAGAIGGLVGGIAAGAAVAYASAGTPPQLAGVLALTLSIAAQGGDLLESWVKRRFGAKDTSTLIPGHGGVMDRVDGFLVAALVAVLIGALRFGWAAAARGLLVW